MSPGSTVRLMGCSFLEFDRGRYRGRKKIAKIFLRGLTVVPDGLPSQTLLGTNGTIACNTK